jgi:hypothetical protein
MNVFRVCVWFTLVGVVSGLIAGCGAKPVPPRQEAEVHILNVMKLWAEYRHTFNKVPASTAELTNWARSLKPDDLAKLGIQNLDEALVSPRDHEPYQVTPGKPNRMGIIPVVIYEKTGVAGKRLTASSMGQSGELNEEALRNTVPGF